uniref:Uncharacterized protein n=1 Tax=Sipha flava TaxID=143950 RepID=A0A2S2QQV3_9HEMI
MRKKSEDYVKKKKNLLVHGVLDTLKCNTTKTHAIYVIRKSVRNGYLLYNNVNIITIMVIPIFVLSEKSVIIFVPKTVDDMCNRRRGKGVISPTENFCFKTILNLRI